MQKYWNTVQDEHGSPRYGASVVVQQNGVNSTIYTDSSGLIPAANPLTTDSTRGYFEFYAAAGTYDLEVFGVGFSAYTITAGANLGLPSGDVTFTQSDTGAVATDIQTRGRQIVYITDYAANGVSGAKVDPTGVTDSYLGIQAAHDAIVATGVAAVLVAPPGTYKCSGGLTWNATYVHLSAFGATFDFSSKTSGTAISVSNGAPQLDFAGLKLLGNSNAGSVIGIKLFGAAAGSTARDIKLRNLLITTFGTGVQFGDNCFLIDFDHCWITNCTTLVDHEGASNSGASITFYGGLLECTVSGGVIFKTGAAATALDAYLYGCSISSDQTSFTAFQMKNANHVSLFGCHIECSDFATPPVTLSGAGTTFRMHGGVIDSNQVTITANNFVTTDGTVNPLTGGAMFDNVYFNFGTTASGNFCDDAQACRIVNPQGSYAFNISSTEGKPYTNVKSKGTWTPVDSSGATLAFTTVSGTYWRDGAAVWFTFNLTFPVTASGAGIVIGGLPVASASSGPTNPIGGWLQYSDYTTAPIQIVGAQSATTFNLFKGGSTQLVNSDLSGKTIRMQGFYLIA